MPNVAGVQFPYTLPGVQAAQRYERSLSPSRGLGFRPITMQRGGDAEAKAIAQGLYALMSDGTNEQVEAYVNKNRKDLEEIAKIDDRMFDMLRRVLYGDEAVGAGGSQQLEDSVSGLPGYDPETDSFSPAPGDMNMDQGVATGLGRQQALREMNTANDEALFGPVFRGGNFSDVEKEYFQRAFDANRARNQAGTGPAPYLGVPQALPGNIVRDADAAFAARKALEAEQLRAMQGPVSNPPLFPQGMAYGGVPRGTVAGELEPRGYLTARQAGETMRERAKGLRDRRNYGGGIGSLYNRYG